MFIPEWKEQNNDEDKFALNILTLTNTWKDFKLTYNINIIKQGFHYFLLILFLTGGLRKQATGCCDRWDYLFS